MGHQIKWRGWLGHDGWWRKEEWAFELKFTEDTVKKFYAYGFSDLELQEVAPYVTHVHKFHDSKLGIQMLFDALELSKPSLIQHISMTKVDITDADVESLARAIECGCLESLKCLEIGDIGYPIGYGATLGNVNFTLAKAMASGGLLSLKTLVLRAVDLTNVHLEEYGIALGSGMLPNLSSLNVSYNNIGNEGAKSLARAIQSGNLKNLSELVLSTNCIGDDGLIALVNSFQKGVANMLPNLGSLNLKNNSFTEVGMEQALSSGKLLNLDSLNVSSNSLGNKGAASIGRAIRSGKLPNLAELHLRKTDITDEGVIALADSFQEGTANLLPKLTYLNLSSNAFTEVGLLSLVKALKSGHLDSLKVLHVEDRRHPLWRHGPAKVSDKEASSLVSAYSSNRCLTVDVKFEWNKFPELDRRREQLLERNSKYRNILAGLGNVTKVQATFGKVYICGNPEVGKTTLRRTLQRSFPKSLCTWERRPHVEMRTRGINVSQLSSKGNKPDEDAITLQVWDMAGQADFHLVHNAFFPDLGFAEGNATTFIVVCSSKDTTQISKKQLEYWLRYIASSCDKTFNNPRHVFVVMNNIGGDQNLHRHDEDWKLVLEDVRDKFENYLKIQSCVFLVDVRKFRQVKDLKRCLLEHSTNLLRNQEVPQICHAIQQKLTVLSQRREQFPVVHWAEFVKQVTDQLREPWEEHTIEAATKYLNEAGAVIYIHTKGVRLVVVDPNWFCREIIGKVFLPKDMASPRELLFREQVDQSTGSISISNFQKFFKSLEGEWNDAEVHDMITILLWLGLCYRGKDESIFVPPLITERGTPGDHWCKQTPVQHGADQWVMGYSVMHRKTEVSLAPISLWHKFQVDLAQTPRFNGETRPDNDFVVDKYFVTFVVEYMSVLIKVDANLEIPTFEEIEILIKPRFEPEEMEAFERKQLQVDLANDLVERLLKLWNQVCVGVEYEKRIIWPWPTSCSRPKDIPERTIEVAKVKKWVLEHGVGKKMQWPVGDGDTITEDQLLSTKDKEDVVTQQSSQMSRSSGIKRQARQINDSLFELYRPANTPKVQIVFFHGLQMDDYSDAHLSTWESGDGSVVWPQTWLVEEISGAHVLSVSYNGGLNDNSNGSVDLFIIGENLLSDLLQDDIGSGIGQLPPCPVPGIGQVPHCPVVLVGHCIGGLVIKELCCRAHNKLNRSQDYDKAKLENFLNNVRGIFYYSTPHHGSGVAEILAKQISSPLLTYFETLSKDTARLNYEFEAICKVKYKDWLFAGLGEALRTDLGPVKAGIASTTSFVVPEASARAENFNVVEGADHFSVCRPKSKTTRSFYKLTQFVSQIASKASDAEMIPLLGSSNS